MRDNGFASKIHLPAVMSEFIATTLFLFITMTAIAASARDIVAVALVFGGTITILIIVFTHHSGAHMNPAVTVGLWVTKRLDNLTAFAYIVAQMGGAVLGAYLARWALPQGTTLEFGLTTITRNVHPVSALLVEVLLTFVLVTVIFATSVDHRNDRRFAPLAIGMAVTVAVFAGGPITGAALNPARWFGPALVEGSWAAASTYAAGPLLGAMLGALVYQQFLLPKDLASADDEEE